MAEFEYDFHAISNKEEFLGVRKNHAKLPKSILMKSDLVRRGVKFTDRAKKAAQDPDRNYQMQAHILFQQNKEDVFEMIPYGFWLDDGTLVLVASSPDECDPYLIDIGDDGEFWTYFSDGTPFARINFNEKPRYYDKKTRSGELMQYVGFKTGSDCILFCSSRYCHYWSKDNQCVFCDLTRNLRFQKKAGRGFKTRATPEDFYDTMAEVLKEGGRWRHFLITGGADPREGHQREFDYSLDLIKSMTQAGKDVGIDNVHLYLIGSPLAHDEFVQLKEAGLDAYGIYFEIWDKEHFKYMCPGKTQFQGWDLFLERTLDAVQVFGRGNALAGFVPGVEMMPEPYGFGMDMDAAVRSSLEGYEFCLKNGISLAGTNLTIEPGTKLYEMGAAPPPLEFYARLEEGRIKLLRQYPVYSKCMCWQHQPYGLYADCQRYM